MMVITYDVDDNQTEFKDELKSRGYTDHWFDDDGRKVELPDTTLVATWVSSTKKIVEDMEDAAIEARCEITKVLVFKAPRYFSRGYDKPKSRARVRNELT